MPAAALTQRGVLRARVGRSLAQTGDGTSAPTRVLTEEDKKFFFDAMAVRPASRSVPQRTHAGAEPYAPAAEGCCARETASIHARDIAGVRHNTR